MNSAEKLFAGAAVAALVLAVSKPARRRKRASKPARRRKRASKPARRRRRTNDRTVGGDAPPRPPAPRAAQPGRRRANGLSLEPDKLTLVDWSAWMETAPAMLRATLQEGTRDPEVVVANLFRRLYPETAWPPSEDSPLYFTWTKIVALVGRSLERPFKPHLEVVS